MFSQIKRWMGRNTQQGETPQSNPQIKQNSTKNAERYYRLGNHFYEADAPAQAKQAWERSVVLRHPVPLSAPRPWSNLWGTVGATILILLTVYSLIVLAFPRKDDMLEMLLLSMQQSAQQEQELSLWDRFWMSNRPMERQYVLEQAELWSILSRQMEDLMEYFTPDKQVAGTPEDQLVDLLNRLRYPNTLYQIQGKSQYYYLIGKGLFNLREHPHAIDALQQGLGETNHPQERGMLFQEMATIYYFQGYQLQPNGLAKYDLELVRKSIDAYLEAQQYIQDPYLYGNLGWGYYLLADYERAVHYGQRALELNENLSYVRMNLGITYIRMNNYQKAFESYQGLFQYDPNTIDYLGGLRDLEELDRDHKGQYPFVHFVRGYIYFHQENFFKAQEAWETFLNQPFADNSWKQKTQKFLQTMKRNG